MNIYLDITGVLVSRDGTVSKYVNEFLAALEDNECNIYWLLKEHNHLEGAHYKKLVDGLSHHGRNVITAAAIAEWDLARTDGIDYSEPFLWFTPSVDSIELEDLRLHSCTKNLILSDIDKDARNLKKYTSHLPKALIPNTEHSPFPHRSR